MSITSTSVLAYNPKDPSKGEPLPGYTPDSDNNLEIRYPDGHHVTRPGIPLSKAATRLAPELGTKTQLPGTYVLIMVDPDAPFVSSAFLSPIIHWVQYDLVSGPAGPVSETAGEFFPLKSQVAVTSPYLPPGPPPGVAPHRYVFLLYEQPTGFKAPAGPVSKFARMRFDLAGFERKAGLKGVVASNYYLTGSST